MELKNILTPWNWFKKEEEQAVESKGQGRISASPQPLVRLHQDMNQLFDHLFQGFPLSTLRWPQEWPKEAMVFPQLNIAENNSEYVITVDVPGVEEKDIELTAEDGSLIIRGEKHHEKEDQHSRYHCIERSYGVFQRVLSLPTDAHEDQITAKFNNGVLTVTVGKDPSLATRGRKIAIT